jgi:uncharacterized protein
MPRLRIRALLVCLIAFIVAASAPRAVSPNIVISQVYGGGGGSTGSPTYKADFIELFNRGTTAVSLAGWSLQYASATGTGNFGANSGQLTELPNVTLSPGQYYLVQESTGTAGGALPAPDLIDASPIAMAVAAGKVALVSQTTTLGCNGGSNPCSAAQLAAIVDLVGYGTGGSGANFYEGAGPAPTLSATTAAFRANAGCTDTDGNSADFSAATPAARNAATALNPCTTKPALSINDVSVVEGDAGTVTASFTVSLNSPAPAGGVSFDIATQNDTATAGSDYVAKSLTSQLIAAGQTAYTFSVTINSDIDTESNESFFVNVTNVSSGAIAGDTQGVGTILTDDVAPPVFDIVISQVYGGGGNSGATYKNDFVELFNRGATPVSLAGWSVQYISANGTGTWQATPIGGTIAPGGYYLVQQAAGTGGSASLPAPDASGSVAMGSTGGKIALVTTTTQMIGQCGAVSKIIDLVGYGVSNCFETAPAAATANALAALRKRGGCVDTNDNSADFLIGSPAPRNSSSPARSCTYTTKPIHDIQGDGLQTPLAGQDVSTSGIVTGVKANGFFLQAPDAEWDNNPATSEGIYVFTASAPAVLKGDLVNVKGTATEYFDLTQLESTLTGDVEIVSSANVLPAAVTLTTAILDAAGSASQLEPLEGMRVYAASLTSVGPSNSFGEILTVLTGVARPMRQPGIPLSSTVPPDPETSAIDCCIPRFDENPERVMLDSDGLAGTAAVHATSNVTFADVSGPLDFTFGNYKLLPETAPVRTADMTAVAAPAPAANEFTVSGYNIENFRSSNTTQLAKAALTIRTVLRYPDVIGTVEILDLASLQALADRVNADAVAAGDPDPAYQAHLIPASPTATQNVGFLIRTSRVLIESVTQELASETYIDPETNQPAKLHDRPPLVLRGTVLGDGIHTGPVIVLVNHLRSFIDAELLTSEGARVRAKRTAQAESIAALLQQLQTDNPGTPVISVGDYNAFQFNDGYTDPISVLKGTPTPGDQVVVPGSPDLVNPNYVNLTDTLPADQQYSYVFDGTPQALDHVIVNQAALGYLQRYAIAHMNADFPEYSSAGLAGNTARPEVNSDHDATVAYFAFPGTPVVTLNGGATMTVEAYGTFTDPGATAHDDDGALTVTAGGAVDMSTPGDYTLTYSASNISGTTTVERLVHVVDTTAPAIDGFAVTPSSLGPPNHKLANVAVFYTKSDASGFASCTLSVTSNEPLNATGDGNTAVDFVIIDAHQLQLRAERSGRGSGRVYTVKASCTDNAGNISTASGTVTVAK